MNIVFKADLSALVAHRPSVLYWVMRPGAETGGIGMVLVRMVRPWSEWLLTWGYDITQPPPRIDEAEARRIVHDLVGDDTIDVEITSTSLWTVTHNHATRYSAGRVFCAGDAVHRHPPSNGLGSNTSVQDTYNLAWKLALVVRGQAGPELLETYTAERAPIGKQIVDRANLSRDQFGPIFQALGVAGGIDDEGIEQALAACRAEDAEGAKRRRELETAIELKNYEFNAHGVELDQRYSSTAVIEDGRPEETGPGDPELYHRPTTRPGAKLPHAWLIDAGGHRLSTLDLVGKGDFTLVTGLSGAVWESPLPGPVPRNWASRCASYASALTPLATRTATGTGSRRSRRTAACWCGPTVTSPGAAPAPPERMETRTANSSTHCGPCWADGTRAAKSGRPHRRRRDAS